jgi:hypothetical protein
LATTSSPSSSSSSPDDEKKSQMLADHSNNLDGRNERILSRPPHVQRLDGNSPFLKYCFHDDYDWQSPQQ